MTPDDARLLAVLAEYDHVEGGAGEDADGSEGLADAVAGVRPETGVAPDGRPGAGVKVAALMPP